MDPDSFLNLLSPQLDEIHEWCPGSQLDDWNQICEDSSQFESFDDSLWPKKKSASYSSVLTLTDIASALHGFSRAAPKCPPARKKSASPPPIIINRPHGHALMDRIKLDLDSDDNEDVKPFTAPSSSPLHRRPHAPTQSSPAKRPKTSTATVDSQISPSVSGELQCKTDRKQGLSQREVHIHSERQRRRSMRESFTTLQSLIPKLKLKHTDRITVLTEVITYIQSLRGTLEELERKKSDILTLLGFPEDYPSKQHVSDSLSRLDRLKGHSGDMPEDSVSMIDVTVRLSGSDVFVTLNSPKLKGVWSAVLMLLQRYNVEVVNATLATSGESNFHCIHGKVANISKVENIGLQDKLEALILKELWKRPRC